MGSVVLCKNLISKQDFFKLGFTEASITTEQAQSSCGGSVLRVYFPNHFTYIQTVVLNRDDIRMVQ